MRLKTGTGVPNKGTELHRADGDPPAHDSYALAIAGALRHELGATHQAIKTAMRWTNASERTVKYWFAGTKGPNGAHLISLARHSDAVLELFLERADRKSYLGAIRIMAVHDKLKELLEVLQTNIDGNVES